MNRHSVSLSTGRLLTILFGIASITLDVERIRSRVWCSICRGCGGARVGDGGINRSLLLGFVEDGPGS